MGVRSDWSIVALIIVSTAAPTGLDAQTRPSTRKPAPAATRKPTIAPAELACPSSLCRHHQQIDVLRRSDQPRPQGRHHHQTPGATWCADAEFNLHNRHTYSEEQVRLKRAFASYTASIGVLTLDNTLPTRAVVASEFRWSRPCRANHRRRRPRRCESRCAHRIRTDIGGDSSPTSPKSRPCEKLTVVDVEGVPATYSAPGRPIARHQQRDS